MGSHVLRMRRKERSSAGFTLIELLVMVGLISILAVLLVVAVGTQSSSSARSACVNDYNAVQTAVESYRQQIGVYPGASSLPSGDTATTVAPSPTPPAGWDGVKFLLGTVRNSSATPASTVGPWLRANPVKAGRYQILVQDTGAGSGSGLVGVFTISGTQIKPPGSASPLNSSADCKGAS